MWAATCGLRRADSGAPRSQRGPKVREPGHRQHRARPPHRRTRGPRLAKQHAGARRSAREVAHGEGARSLAAPRGRQCLEGNSGSARRFAGHRRNPSPSTRTPSRLISEPSAYPSAISFFSRERNGIIAKAGQTESNVWEISRNHSTCVFRFIPGPEPSRGLICLQGSPSFWQSRRCLVGRLSSFAPRKDVLSRSERRHCSAFL